MENSGMNGFWGDGIWAIIIFFIVAGMFSGNGFGFGNNAKADITNEFLYNQLANDVRANGQAINTTDRDVLTSSCNTDKEVLQSRYDSQLASANTNSLIQSCCCENRLAIANQTNDLTAQMTANTQAILDKLCSQEIQNLRDQVAGYRETLSNANQTQNILNVIGTWRANPPYPYYGTYPYSGTTIV